MRVLLDANLPHDLRHHIVGHHVETARYAGLNNLDDGPLLDPMTGRFDVLVTADKNIAYQQLLSGRAFGVIVLRASTNRIHDLVPIVPNLLSALSGLQPGEVREIGR